MPAACRAAVIGWFSFSNINRHLMNTGNCRDGLVGVQWENLVLETAKVRDGKAKDLYMYTLSNYSIWEFVHLVGREGRGRGKEGKGKREREGGKRERERGGKGEQEREGGGKRERGGGGGREGEEEGERE